VNHHVTKTGCQTKEDANDTSEEEGSKEVEKKSEEGSEEEGGKEKSGEEEVQEIKNSQETIRKKQEGLNWQPIFSRVGCLFLWIRNYFPGIALSAALPFFT
jgi:hypothetical protein